MKTDLHLHGLLSAPLSIYEEIAGWSLPKLPAKFESFESFNDYLFQNLILIIQSPEHVRKIIRGAFQRLIDDDVVYAEVSFDVMIPDLIQVSSEAFFEILTDEKKRVSSQIEIGLEVGMSRKTPPALLFQKVREWVSSKIFSSVDLYDDERVGRAEDFVEIYRFCESAGLKLKAHVGEFGPAHSVKEYVKTLHLNAVQHGIRSVDDPSVMDYLAKKGTVLNICPTSNVALGACPSYQTHPAKKLFDAGIQITVNTDDYALFGASLEDELKHLSKMGFSENDIAQILQNGLSQQT